MTHPEHLEQGAHAARVRIGEAGGRGIDGRGLIRRRPDLEPLGAHQETEPEQEIALRRGPVHRRALGARRAGERSEIDVKRQVGFARAAQRIGEAMACQRLEGIAETGPVVPVIDGEEGAAPCGEAPGEIAHHGKSLTRHGQRGTLGRLRSEARIGFRVEAEGQGIALRREADAALAPAVAGPHELAGGQGVEELVGDDEERRIGQALHRVVEDRRGRGQALRLKPAQNRAGLDEVEIEGGARRAQGSQGVGHQRAAAGAEFHEAGACRRACRLHRREHGASPGADQLAEHLADLRRGDEVAAAAEGIARGVVAVARMPETERHVAIETDRPARADLPREDREERRRLGGHAQICPASAWISGPVRRGRVTPRAASTI